MFLFRFPPASRCDPAVLRFPAQPNPPDLSPLRSLPPPVPSHLALPPRPRPHVLWDSLPLAFLPRETLPVLAPLLPQDTRYTLQSGNICGILSIFSGDGGIVLRLGKNFFEEYPPVNTTDHTDLPTYCVHNPSISWGTQGQCLLEYSLKYTARWPSGPPPL